MSDVKNGLADVVRVLPDEHVEALVDFNLEPVLEEFSNSVDKENIIVAVGKKDLNFKNFKGMTASFVLYVI